MLPLRTRIFIVISLIVLVVLGISILVWVLGKSPAPTPASDVNESGSTTSLPAGTVLYNGAPVLTAPIQQGLTPKPLTTLETEQNGVKQIARIFIERYGSYSTDSNFQNIREVRALVTENLWGQISDPLAKDYVPSPDFVGVTTNVIGIELSDWQGAAAGVTVKAVSVSEKDNTETTSQRTARVDLVKSGNSWLVDKFVWEK